MKNLIAIVGLILVACLVSACDLDQDIPGNTGDSVATCTGDKADDPNCVEPDTTESPPGDDSTSESFDSESTSSEDSDPSVECIPAYPYPDGTWVQCGSALYPCQILWDLSNCTLSCWEHLGEPPPLFGVLPQDAVFSPQEDGESWCVPLPGQ